MKPDPLPKKYQLQWGDLKGAVVTKEELKNILDKKVLVRDDRGDEVNISELKFIFHKNRYYKESQSTGNITPKLKKLVKKMKRTGVFTIVVTIFHNGEFVEVARSFEVVKD